MKKHNPIPETPTLDKLRSVKDKSQGIGEFLEWLQSEQKVQLMLYHEHTDRYLDEDGDHQCGLSKDSMLPEYRSIERLLAEFFEIDLVEVEVEKERQALLDWQRAQNT